MQYKDTQVSNSLAPQRATDPGWAHGTMVNGGRQKIKCKYCHKIFLGGGISRLKQHLAGERGNVAPCEDVPEEVKVQIQQHLGFKVLERLKKQKEANGSKNSYMLYLRDREEDDVNLGSGQKEASRRRDKEVLEGISKRTKRRKKQNYSMATSVITQPICQSFAPPENIELADVAVARFFYEAGIPFTAANSYFFQQMADNIIAAGPGYKMPSYTSLRGKLLNRCIQDAEEYCSELRKSWEVTGCTVLVDRWMHGRDRTVINFFVYCPKGTMFLRSVDASGITKSVEALLNLFDSVVQQVGLKNIVNFVTDSVPTYKNAGKLLAEKYKTFFCSTCGAECINLMLEEIGESDGIKEVLAKAKRLTQFIYNNSWVLNLMRKRTGGKDIIQLARTRFASIFLTLQTIVSLKDHLHKMFTSASWMQSSFPKQRAGIEVAEILVDPRFWSLCDQTLTIAKPILSVLHLIDCQDKPSMGYIYDAIEKAKKSIVVGFNNKESDYLSYLKVIDHVWQEDFHSPLHAAAHYLNPSVIYNPSFSSNKFIQKGLLDCIETLEPNLSAQVTITSQIKFYEEAVGDFGRPMALRGRESLAPATWWSLYAADYPDLQRLAIRILSQTCSLTRCERNWSMFERTHSKKRNRLEHQRLNDLTFVHYNLYLQERRAETTKSRYTRGTLDPICLEAMDAYMGDWVEDLATMEGENISWMDVTVPRERTFVMHDSHQADDSNDSTDDRSSEVTKGMDGDDDL
ncbi:uncharacterized protein LOC8289331 isoform X2 [Ricinus communis]|uniref:uncharacterized protein LOC8289331 isoform X2 n=1 Tax=Ricinus communis TaxID=3988 RepID=UPI000772AE62|nr:uncharacterized protein LOC8289331 isoform X2 [Ricinus communis]|eukprot:XP_015584619.1 uncharacterized protein LOC8289331 isoform X2 [Ricinus communis]